MGLLTQSNRYIHFFINITRDICKLLRWVVWVTLVDDLVVMTPFHKLSKIVHFIDIVMSLFCELGKALLEMWMEGSRVNKQLFPNDVFPQSILGDHTLNSRVKDAFGLPFEHMLHLSCLQVSNVSRVLTIQFLLSLASSHVLDLGVDHYNEVTMLTCISGNIVWLVLASQEVSC